MTTPVAEWASRCLQLLALNKLACSHLSAPQSHREESKSHGKERRDRRREETGN